MTLPHCRHCRSPLATKVLDLGASPPSNAYLSEAELQAPEKTFPLRILLCDNCLLVQTEDFTDAEALFSRDYAYFSSTSRSWLQHAADYVAMIVGRLGLGPRSFVVELASNDGYLLRNFVARGIPCLGYEPTASTAAAAEALNIPVRRAFFGEAEGQSLAAAGRNADLVIGNNVYAHVPDINDFTRGIAALLAPEGVVTLEFPHLMRLFEFAQFDTVYHEHFSYLSLLAVSRVFAEAGLRIFDVEELPTHGGSLRIYGCRAAAAQAATPAVARMLGEERRRGMETRDFYLTLQPRADAIRRDLVAFLQRLRAEGKTIAAYGAAAKGNTLLNYAGVGPDLLPYVCDAAAAKQGRFLPGSRIPILAPAVMMERQPDYVLILPWNIKDEIAAQLAPLTRRGARLVTAVPRLVVH